MTSERCIHGTRFPLNTDGAGCPSCLGKRVQKLAFVLLNREGRIDDVWHQANTEKDPFFLGLFRDVGGLNAALSRETKIWGGGGGDDE